MVLTFFPGAPDEGQRLAVRLFSDVYLVARRPRSPGLVEMQLVRGHPAGDAEVLASSIASEGQVCAIADAVALFADILCRAGGADGATEN